MAWKACSTASTPTPARSSGSSTRCVNSASSRIFLASAARRLSRTICSSCKSAAVRPAARMWTSPNSRGTRSEEHTSELQSLRHLVCRLLLEKKKNKKKQQEPTKTKKAKKHIANNGKHRNEKNTIEHRHEIRD